LTFDPENVTTHQGYQGVFFRWGSLVGISPARVTNPVADADAFIGEEVPLYVPTGYPSNPAWVATTSSQEGYNTWVLSPENLGNNKEIPYMDYVNFLYPDEQPFDLTDTYAIDAARNTTEVYQGLRGDICQYLSTKTGVVSGDYRLPTMVEFGAVNPINFVLYDWSPYGNFGVDNDLNDVLSADGTTTIIGGAYPYDRGYAENAMMPGRFFPASGSREALKGVLSTVGGIGFYRSGLGMSYYSHIATYVFVIEDNRVVYNINYMHGSAYSVRCIKN
jgi:hypothetical protein